MNFLRIIFLSRDKKSILNKIITLFLWFFIGIPYFLITLFTVDLYYYIKQLYDSKLENRELYAPKRETWKIVLRYFKKLREENKVKNLTFS